MLKENRYIILLTIITLFQLAGCQSPYQSPIADIDEPRFLDSDRIHRVNGGETLYAVAWIYDLDFMHIARANSLSSPYTILPGQILNVDPRAELPQQTSNNSASTVDAPSTSNNREVRRENSTGSPVAVRQDSLNWTWPAQGNIIGRLSETGLENKGIDISGQKGDDVMSAADGEVVYAGNGLLRYGDLVIIKHNDLFLSAYAHNNTLLVGEGDKVSGGQKIAELGSTGVDKEMLHFEIRLEGKPVDPLSYLPPRS